MDLTEQYPASPNELLGGIVLIKRMVDKAHAHREGTLGEYRANCPHEQAVYDFVGIGWDDLCEMIYGLQYSEPRIEQWLNRILANKKPAEIAEFNATLRAWAPDASTQAEFDALKAKVAPGRNDVVTWFQLLDIDEKRGTYRAPYSELRPVLESRRFASPTAGNTSLALEGDNLLVGSILTNELHAVDLKTETSTMQFKLPAATAAKTPETLTCAADANATYGSVRR